MNGNEIEELRKKYSEWSNEYIIERLYEGKSTYIEGAYEVLCQEATKRGIKIPDQNEILNYKGEHDTSIKKETLKEIRHYKSLKTPFIVFGVIFTLAFLFIPSAETDFIRRIILCVFVGFGCAIIPVTFISV